MIDKPVLKAERPITVQGVLILRAKPNSLVTVQASYDPPKNASENPEKSFTAYPFRNR